MEKRKAKAVELTNNFMTEPDAAHARYPNSAPEKQKVNIYLRITHTHTHTHTHNHSHTHTIHFLFLFLILHTHAIQSLISVCFFQDEKSLVEGVLDADGNVVPPEGDQVDEEFREGGMCCV